MSEFNTTLTEPWLPSVLGVLGKQEELIERLDQLAQSQTEVIAQGRTDRLMELLARRQTIIDEITANLSNLTELTNKVHRVLPEIAPLQRERIRSLIKRIGERLNQVMRRDEQDEAMLRSHRNQIKQEMTTLDTGRQARSAYQNAPLTPCFADHSG